MISAFTPRTESNIHLPTTRPASATNWLLKDAQPLDGVSLGAGTVSQLASGAALQGLPATPSKPGYSQMQKEAARKALDCGPAQPSQREPKRSLWETAITGLGDLGGKAIRTVGDAAGTVGGFVVENNPVALASRAASGAANLVGAKDAASFLGAADQVSREAGKVTKSAIRGVGEFGAGTVEGTAQMIGDPVGTVKAVGVLASSGLDAVPVVGELYSRGEAAVRGTDLATVRAEKKSNREAIVSGFVDDFQEKQGRIGTAGALVSSLLDVGVPTKLAQSTIRRTVSAQKLALKRNPQFKEMAPDQQAALREMASNNAPHLGSIKLPFQVGRSEQALSKLVGEGRLQSGREGAELLGQLKDLDGNPVAQGLSKRRIFKEAVETVVAPGKCNQAGKGTCAVTTTQYDMARERPADFLQTARGLTSPEGEVVLRGTTLKRNPTGLGKDFSGRRDLDRVMQSTFMEQANRYRPTMTYDNRRDGHIDKATGIKVHGGLFTDQSTQVRELLLDRSLTIENFPDRSHPGRAAAEQAFADDLKRASEKGTSIQAGMNWGSPDSGHAITIERLEGDYVYGRNPWGSQDKGQGGVARTMTDKEGRFKMKTSDFFDNLRDYASPSKWW